MAPRACVRAADRSADRHDASDPNTGSSSCNTVLGGDYNFVSGAETLVRVVSAGKLGVSAVQTPQQSQSVHSGRLAAASAGTTSAGPVENVTPLLPQRR